MSSALPAGDVGVWVRQFAAMDAATIYEAAGKQGMMDPHIKPIWSEALVCGPAYTVSSAPGDNLTLHRAVARAKPGDVLVVTVSDCVTVGHWGEILTVAAQVRGIAGLVIDGAIRDSRAIKALGFPVFARGIAIGAPAKAQVGSIDAPVECGGVRVSPGDIVFGDADGVVAVRRDRAPEVLAGSVARTAKESAMMQQIREGRTTLELLGLDGEDLASAQNH